MRLLEMDPSSFKVELAEYAVIFYISYKLITYIQRLFFHPLSKFPGPKIAAASKLYEFYWDSYKHGRLWAKLPELHRRYGEYLTLVATLTHGYLGPIIRIGPNEIHVEDSQYFDTIFGFRPLNKEALTAKEFGINHALFGVEDYKTYTKKRAAFGDAFSRSKLFKIQDQINKDIENGCAWVEEQSKDGGPVDLA